jgi:hypothetical protein
MNIIEQIYMYTVELPKVPILYFRYPKNINCTEIIELLVYCDGLMYACTVYIPIDQYSLSTVMSHSDHFVQ